MAIICVDTQLVIWGFRKNASPGQENKIILAEKLIEHISTPKNTLALTSITLAEASAIVPQQDIPSFIQRVQQYFMVIPFDALGAYHYQQLYKAHCSKIPQWKNEKYTRINIVTDMKILASALSRHVDDFYTDNMKDFTKIADGFNINVKPVPLPEPEQLSLLPQQ